MGGQPPAPTRLNANEGMNCLASTRQREGARLKHRRVPAPDSLHVPIEADLKWLAFPSTGEQRCVDGLHNGRGQDVVIPKLERRTAAQEIKQRKNGDRPGKPTKTASLRFALVAFEYFICVPYGHSGTLTLSQLAARVDSTEVGA